MAGWPASIWPSRKASGRRAVLTVDELAEIRRTLKAAGRGLVVGETTAGRAVGQRVFLLPGSGWSLRFVSAVYRTPKGEPILGKGVKPDMRVAVDEKELDRLHAELLADNALIEGEERQEVHDIFIEKAVEYLGGTGTDLGKKPEAEGKDKEKKGDGRRD